MINQFKIEWYVELNLDMTLILPKYLGLYYFYIIYEYRNLKKVEY